MCSPKQFILSLQNPLALEIQQDIDMHIEWSQTVTDLLLSKPLEADAALHNDQSHDDTADVQYHPAESLHQFEIDLV